MNELSSNSPTPPIRPANRPWYRRKRTWLGVVGLMILSIGLSFYWQLTRDSVMLRAVEAELDAKEPGWRSEDLVNSLPKIPDDENYAQKLRKLRARIPLDWGENPAGQRLSLAFVGIAQEYSPNRALPHEIRLFVQAELDRVEGIRTELFKIPITAKGQPPIELRLSEAHIPQEYWFAVFELHHLVYYVIYNQIDAGDFQGVCKSLGLMTQLEKLTYSPTSLGGAYRAFRVRERAVYAVQHAINMGEVPEEDLQRLQSLMQLPLTPDNIRDVLRFERAYAHRFVAAAAEGRLPPDWIANEAEQRRKSATTWFGRYAANYFQKDSLVPGRVAAIRGITKAIEQADRPYFEFKKTCDDLLVRSRPETNDLLTIPPGLAREIHRTRALADCAVVGIAAERYRQMHGRWPTSQDDLVPAFLDKALLDPFDVEHPIRIRHVSDGIVAYSVGPKQDGEGNAYDALTTPTERLANKRFEFRVWNPRLRRLPAPQISEK